MRPGPREGAPAPRRLPPGPTARRWRSPTSGSGAPPEVQRRHRTFGKRPARVPQGSDILTLPGSHCPLHFSKPQPPLSARLTPLPCPHPTPCGSGAGEGPFTSHRGQGKKMQTTKTVQAPRGHHCGFPASSEQEKGSHGRPTRWLHAERKEKPEWD